MRDYYKILGIRPDATQAEIKEAWNFSIKAFHPDKFAGSSQRQQAVAQERTKAINEAYELLKDPIRRAGYDRECAREPRTHSGPPPQKSPPPPPAGSPPILRRRKIAFAALILILAAVVTLVVLASSGVLKRSATLWSKAPDNPWADWQLPVRIGDSIDAVRTTLGQDRSTWQDKGLEVSFENDHVSSIYVYTVDRFPIGEHSHVRKYDGAIIAGVNADEGLEQLIQKLGKPSEVTDFNRNDKTYQWRRKAYVINARIAMEDLVGIAGLPFKKHQIEGVISIDDIAPYLQADRDEELRRQILEKEKGLVTLSGAVLSPTEIFQKYSGRVVEVQAINSKGVVASKGTGFIWRRNEVLTNYHVIEEARSLKMQRGSQSQELGLNLSMGDYGHFSKEQDWVQLGALGMDTELPPVACAMDTPEIGENITVIGNPEGLKNSLSTGIVAGIREIGGNQWVQITAPVSPGSSGSPVFDSKGRLLGLATMMLLDGQNLNFATPVRQVEAGIAKKTEPTFLPLRSVWVDKEYQRRKEALESGGHDSKEIEAFAQEFLKKYSDPDDKAEVFDAVAGACEANGQFRTALKMQRKKIELFGALAGDYLLTASLLEKANDIEGMKRELRSGIMFGVRQLLKEYLATGKARLSDRRIALALGDMFNRLGDRQGAAQWFDIWLLPDSAWGEARMFSDKILPPWYQSERSARGKNETDPARLLPDDAESYLNSLRDRWLSQNEKEIVSLMRYWLPDEAVKQILKMGIDSISTPRWEEEVRPRLTEDQWLVLRRKLDERKSL